MSTRIDIANRLSNQFSNSIFYDPLSVNDTIQDGLDEICAFTGAVYGSIVLPFTQFTTYYDFLTLIPNYIGVISIWNTVTRRWLFPSSLKKFSEVRIDWDTAGGTPYWFCPISHRYVAIFMKPLTTGYGNMIVYYRAAAPTLTNNTQIPLPDEHLTVLESYSTADMWEQAQEWGKAGKYLETYIKNIEDLRVLMRNKRNPDRYVGLR